MSQQPERKEKDCLNCGADVQGRYCHVCGQENIVVKQNALAMVRHFVYDIFHFDGKFFDTLRPLFFKPGFVPKQYISGKRMSYLDPIRMYLFTSAVFFLIFFSIKDFKIDTSDDWEDRLTRQQRIDLIYALNSPQANIETTFRDSAIRVLIDSSYQVVLKKPKAGEKDSIINFRGSTYKFVTQRDTATLVSDKEPKERNWIERILEKPVKKFEDDPKQGFALLIETFVHRLPYMLFISLPIFALILKLVYVRRKQFYYSEHLVFTLYHYIFSFITLLVITFLENGKDKWGWGIFSWITGLLILFWFFYLYKSMRRFYEQSRGKTILKFLLVNILGMVLISLLFLAFLLITAIQL